jgi:hypothetical protein
MPPTPARPAGADNFLRWRRTIDEHLELGRLTWDEYGMFSWLCIKADARTGGLRTSWPTLADQTTLTPNCVGKLCRGLKQKGYITFKEHRGRRGGLVEVAIDKFPLPGGSYTALHTASRRSQAEVLAEVPAEVPAELAARRAGKSTTSPPGRSRKRSRSRSSLRVRSADRVSGLREGPAGPPLDQGHGGRLRALGAGGEQGGGRPAG